jgi:hypothetical protein
MDWAPGSWLSSWEVNLPPVSKPRYFSDDSRDKTIWLLTGSASDASEDDQEEDESDEDQGWADEDDSTTVELAKDLVACWPNSAAEIAHGIGTTARDLKWFLDDKAGLDEVALSKLRSVLGIERTEEGHEASGPCVLVAADVHAAARIFQRPFGGKLNIMMFERGSKAADRLNDKAFNNFEGLRKVSGKLYRDVVATCARASLSPLANLKEMRGFEERHADDFS